MCFGKHGVFSSPCGVGGNILTFDDGNGLFLRYSLSIRPLPSRDKDPLHPDERDDQRDDRAGQWVEQETGKVHTGRLSIQSTRRCKTDNGFISILKKLNW